MNSEWWEQSFAQTYDTFSYILVRILSCVTIVRISMGMTSHPSFLQYPQREIMFLIVILALSLSTLKQTPLKFRQIYLYALLELINISLKLVSVYIYPREANLLLMESTLLTILFQTKIFQSMPLITCIVAKHILLWHFVEFFTGEVGLIMPHAILMCLTDFSLWMMFETTHRFHIKESYLNEKAIKKTNTQIAELLRLFCDGLIIMDREFIAMYTNETINRILKVSDKDYSSKLQEIEIKDSQVSIAKRLKEIEWKNSDTSISIGITCMDKSLYEWNVKIVDWEDELCYMITVKNVTKILEFERVEAENRSKTELIRSVSHELRTPINAMMLIIEDLFGDIPLQYKDKLSMVKTCVELLNYQISDILDYSELASGKFKLNPTCCNIKEALENCVRLVKLQALHKGLELIIAIDPLVPNSCLLDEFRVRKVVMNLLSNAIKFTNKGCIKLYAIVINNLIEIGVKDTGIGIQKERLVSIFEMFSESYDGLKSSMSGLGLYISNNILKLAQTSLKVNSIIGQGSVFSFSLPAIISNPQIKLHTEIKSPSKIRNEEEIDILHVKFNCLRESYPKILIVDDNDFNRLVLGNILKKHKIPYLEAFNGEVAVDIVLQCDKNNCPVSCVIMDCNMPVMDGWEATKNIIKMHTEGIIQHPPNIIGHTAYTSKSDIKRCYDSGMISHFLKPTSQNQFLTIINNYV